MYGTRKGVTADNFFTSCELANLLLTKNMTVIGMLRKRASSSSIIAQWKTKERFILLYVVVPARNKTLILLLSQHHDT